MPTESRWVIVVHTVTLKIAYQVKIFVVWSKENVSHHPHQNSLLIWKCVIHITIYISCGMTYVYIICHGPYPCVSCTTIIRALVADRWHCIPMTFLSCPMSTNENLLLSIYSSIVSQLVAQNWADHTWIPHPNPEKATPETRGGVHLAIGRPQDPRAALCKSCRLCEKSMPAICSVWSFMTRRLWWYLDVWFRRVQPGLEIHRRTSMRLNIPKQIQNGYSDLHDHKIF